MSVQEILKASHDPTQCIVKWTVRQKVISLFREPKCFAFSVDGGSRSTFKSPLYEMDLVVRCFFMFHRAIQINLENEEKPHSSCFLPKFYAETQGTRIACVALFGRVDTLTVATGELKGLRWGVFSVSVGDTQNQIEPLEQIFQVNNDVEKAFIWNFPNTNEPKWINGVDKNGKSIKKPAPDHYAQGSYLQRFCVKVGVVTSKVVRVALHYISLMDRRVILDEDNWAVTLVSSMDDIQSVTSQIFSALDNTESGVSQILLGNFGHAMLACEGVNERGSFLTYLHLTQKPKDKSPLLKEEGEAQIESFDRVIPLDTLNGPTWKRSKALVENMFRYASTMRGVPVLFSFYSGFFDIYKRVECQTSKLVDFMAPTLTNLDGDKPTLEFKDIHHTCLEGAQELAEKAGIIFCNSAPLRTPLQKIKILDSAPIVCLPNDFDQKCFGDSLFEVNKKLTQQMLSACVLLTPNDFPPDNCNKWKQQWELERLWAELRDYEYKGPIW